MPAAVRLAATPGAAERFLWRRRVEAAREAFGGGDAEAAYDNGGFGLPTPEPSSTALAGLAHDAPEPAPAPPPSPARRLSLEAATWTPHADGPIAQTRDGAGRERVWLGPTSPSKVLHARSASGDIVPLPAPGGGPTIVARLAPPRVRAPSLPRTHIDGTPARPAPARAEEAVRVVERVAVFHDAAVSAFRDPLDVFRNKRAPDRPTASSLLKCAAPAGGKRGDARSPGRGAIWRSARASPVPFR